jgi:hypothetical protein
MKNRITMLLAAALCLSCAGREEEEPRRAERTVLVYMAADNDLYKNALADIEEMQAAAVPASGNLVAYLDAPAWSADSCPQLLHIHQGKATPVKRYGQQNSASGQVLQTVIGDAMAAFPAASYGLVLWSHGTGWLPKGAYGRLAKSAAPLSASPQSFGRDGGSEMGIAELAEALPAPLEFIIFDACLMGGVEALYQLRRKAAIIVASPTETLAAGFPYTEAVPCLFTTPVGYARLAQAYMSYYKGKSGSEQSATIAAVDAGQLEPLADMLRSILHAGNAQVAPPDKSKIQKYDLLEESVFYDLEDYLRSIIKDPAQLLRLRQQLAKAVIYRDYTPYLLAQLPLARSCGVSVYLPSGNAELDSRYEQLDWYADSGAELLR